MNLKRVGKNSIAVGLGMLLVSGAFAFSAQGATTYKSHAEAQFLSGIGPIGDVIGQVGDAVENKGVVACEPARTGCPEESFVTSPFDPLKQLTGPVGDGIGLKLGAVNNYAVAGKETSGKSLAASGAVDNDGIIRAGGSPTVPLGGATLDLTTGALEPLSALTNLELALGAVSATASLAPDDFNPERDYNIASGEIVLTVPALATLSAGIDTQIGTALGDLNTISLTDICTALAADTALDVICAALPALVDVTITGPSLAELTEGLADVSQNGVTINVDDGTVTIDLDALVLAATGLSINNQPPNTDLLAAILPSLALNLDQLVASVLDEIVQKVIDESEISISLVGVPLPLDLDANQLDAVLGPIADALGTGLNALSVQLAPALTQITDGLADVLQIIVNVPDLYTTTGLVSGDSVSTAAAGQFYSQTALRVIVAGGQLADLRLATAQVGPNGPITIDNQADANADANADVNADADAQADANADADADGAADGGVASTLPNTGSSNVLPLLFMALGLMAFGTTVLVNERRRLKLM